jgi:hypothetical protein
MRQGKMYSEESDLTSIETNQNNGISIESKEMETSDSNLTIGQKRPLDTVSTKVSPKKTAMIDLNFGLDDSDDDE